MVKKYVLTICVAFVLLFIGLYGFVFQTQVGYNDEGTASYILTRQQRDRYTKSKYEKQGFFSIDVDLDTRNQKILKSNNHSQSDLRKYYNKNNEPSEKDIEAKDGICWATAMTSLLEYYGCGPNTNNINKKARAISKKVLDIAKKGKYWSPGSNAVYDSELDDILDDVFASYGGKYEKYDANNDTFSLYKTIKKEINSERVCLLSIIGHAMNACGYEEYTVEYKYTNWLGKTKIKNTREKYVVVNSAQDDCTPYFYYPEDQILSRGIRDLMNFTVTKIIK